MKPVLVLENQLPEKRAYLGTWLDANNIPYEVFNAETHKEFPNSINNYSALAIMGGAMSVNDPYYTHRQAEVLILQCMYRDMPIIGHCLGGQLIAKALGAKVDRSPAPEIGWQKITYLDEPETKEWFGESPTDKVIHWHYESFELPSGAKLLATNEACQNQAFSIGKALAMQYHIEIDEEKISYWVSEDDEKWAENRSLYESVHDKDTILDGILPYLSNHQRTADHIYRNWLRCLFT
jgi:GMP synthase-like glutamine amidotransferase